VTLRDLALLKEQILRLSREYARQAHAAQRPGSDPGRPAFNPGESAIPYAGRVFQEEEVEAAVSASLDFWLTLGPEGEAFESEFAGFLGVRHTLLVNSGSSANLLALTALTSPKIPDKKRLRPGDEVITCAAGFPTTVAPILQNGLVPVFIDNNSVTGNVQADQLEKAFREGKTKAVMIAHTLGNPFDLAAVLSFCRKFDLWLIEDNCDSLGSTYSMPITIAKELGHSENSPGIPADGVHVTRYTGSWGDLSTQSFYPPHHITMGEGGAVNVISHSPLKKLIESFRDWGRDCWCASGNDNTCRKRFDWKLGQLPEGYDHKYIYSHLGYNLKPLDLQAGIGRRQLKRLPEFIQARKRNWAFLRSELDEHSDMLNFSLPSHAKKWSSDIGFSWDETGCRSDCSWFGFMMLVRPNARFAVRDMAKYLDEKHIGNRMLFGGNLIRQPAFVQLKRDNPQSFRSIGEMNGADEIMSRSIFIGVYPGLSDSQLEHTVLMIKKFCEGHKL